MSCSISEIVSHCAEALAIVAATSKAVAKGIEVIFTSLMHSNVHQCVKWHLQVCLMAAMALALESVLYPTYLHCLSCSVCQT